MTGTFGIKVFGIRVLHGFCDAGIGYFRLFRKYGVAWKDVTRHRLYFSERNGYVKALNIGNYRISIIK